MIRKFSTFLSLSLALVIGAHSAKAVTYNISATPANTWSTPSLGVNVGDTVKFLWISGANHTATSNSVPVGAATFDALLDASHTSFSYAVTAPGVYSYGCKNHPNMLGAFVASFKTGVGNLFTEAGITISPNPATSFITIKSTLVNPIVNLTNIIGKNIGTFSGVQTPDGITVDVVNVPSGTYFVTLTSKDMVLTRRIVIAH